MDDRASKFFTTNLNLFGFETESALWQSYKELFDNASDAILAHKFSPLSLALAAQSISHGTTLQVHGSDNEGGHLHDSPSQGSIQNQQYENSLLPIDGCNQQDQSDFPPFVIQPSPLPHSSFTHGITADISLRARFPVPKYLIRDPNSQDEESIDYYNEEQQDYNPTNAISSNINSLSSLNSSIVLGTKNEECDNQDPNNNQINITKIFHNTLNLSNLSSSDRIIMSNSLNDDTIDTWSYLLERKFNNLSLYDPQFNHKNELNYQKILQDKSGDSTTNLTPFLSSSNYRQTGINKQNNPTSGRQNNTTLHSHPHPSLYYSMNLVSITMNDTGCGFTPPPYPTSIPSSEHDIQTSNIDVNDIEFESVQAKREMNTIKSEHPIKAPLPPINSLFLYDPKDHPHSLLSLASTGLFSTTKAPNSGTIGQFGIGMKALLLFAANYSSIFLPQLVISTTSYESDYIEDLCLTAWYSNGTDGVFNTTMIPNVTTAISHSNDNPPKKTTKVIRRVLKKAINDELGIKEELGIKAEDASSKSENLTARGVIGDGKNHHKGKKDATTLNITKTQDSKQSQSPTKIAKQQLTATIIPTRHTITPKDPSIGPLTGTTVRFICIVPDISVLFFEKKFQNFLKNDKSLLQLPFYIKNCFKIANFNYSLYRLPGYLQPFWDYSGSNEKEEKGLKMSDGFINNNNKLHNNITHYAQSGVEINSSNDRNQSIDQLYADQDNTTTYKANTEQLDHCSTSFPNVDCLHKDHNPQVSTPPIQSAQPPFIYPFTLSHPLTSFQLIKHLLTTRNSFFLTLTAPTNTPGSYNNRPYSMGLYNNSITPKNNTITNKKNQKNKNKNNSTNTNNNNNNIYTIPDNPQLTLIATQKILLALSHKRFKLSCGECGGYLSFGNDDDNNYELIKDIKIFCQCNNTMYIDELTSKSILLATMKEIELDDDVQDKNKMKNTDDININNTFNHHSQLTTTIMPISPLNTIPNIHLILMDDDYIPPLIEKLQLFANTLLPHSNPCLKTTRGPCDDNTTIIDGSNTNFPLSTPSHDDLTHFFCSNHNSFVLSYLDGIDVHFSSKFNPIELQHIFRYQDNNPHSDPLHDGNNLDRHESDNYHEKYSNYNSQHNNNSQYQGLYHHDDTTTTTQTYYTQVQTSEDCHEENQEHYQEDQFDHSYDSQPHHQYQQHHQQYEQDRYQRQYPDEYQPQHHTDEVYGDYEQDYDHKMASEHGYIASHPISNNFHSDEHHQYHEPHLIPTLPSPNNTHRLSISPSLPLIHPYHHFHTHYINPHQIDLHVELPDFDLSNDHSFTIDNNNNNNNIDELVVQNDETIYDNDFYDTDVNNLDDIDYRDDYNQYNSYGQYDTLQQQQYNYINPLYEPQHIQEEESRPFGLGINGELLPTSIFQHYRDHNLHKFEEHDNEYPNYDNDYNENDEGMYDGGYYDNQSYSNDHYIDPSLIPQYQQGYNDPNNPNILLYDHDQQFYYENEYIYAQYERDNANLLSFYTQNQQNDIQYTKNKVQIATTFLNTIPPLPTPIPHPEDLYRPNYSFGSDRNNTPNDSLCPSCQQISASPNPNCQTHHIIANNNTNDDAPIDNSMDIIANPLAFTPYNPNNINNTFNNSSNAIIINNNTNSSSHNNLYDQNNPFLQGINHLVPPNADENDEDAPVFDDPYYLEKKRLAALPHWMKDTQNNSSTTEEYNTQPQFVQSTCLGIHNCQSNVTTCNDQLPIKDESFIKHESHCQNTNNQTQDDNDHNDDDENRQPNRPVWFNSGLNGLPASSNDTPSNIPLDLSYLSKSSNRLNVNNTLPYDAIPMQTGNSNDGLGGYNDDDDDRLHNDFTTTTLLPEDQIDHTHLVDAPYESSYHYPLRSDPLDYGNNLLDFCPDFYSKQLTSFILPFFQITLHQIFTPFFPSPTILPHADIDHYEDYDTTQEYYYEYVNGVTDYPTNFDEQQQQQYDDDQQHNTFPQFYYQSSDSHSPTTNDDNSTFISAPPMIEDDGELIPHLEPNIESTLDNTLQQEVIHNTLQSPQQTNSLESPQTTNQQLNTPPRSPILSPPQARNLLESPPPPLLPALSQPTSPSFKLEEGSNIQFLHHPNSSSQSINNTSIQPPPNDLNPLVFLQDDEPIPSLLTHSQEERQEIENKIHNQTFTVQGYITKNLDVTTNQSNDYTPHNHDHTGTDQDVTTDLYENHDNPQQQEQQELQYYDDQQHPHSTHEQQLVDDLHHQHSVDMIEMIEMTQPLDPLTQTISLALMQSIQQTITGPMPWVTRLCYGLMSTIRPDFIVQFIGGISDVIDNYDVYRSHNIQHNTPPRSPQQTNQQHHDSQSLSSQTTNSSEPPTGTSRLYSPTKDPSIQHTFLSIITGSIILPKSNPDFFHIHKKHNRQQYRLQLQLNKIQKQEEKLLKLQRKKQLELFKKQEKLEKKLRNANHHLSTGYNNSYNYSHSHSFGVGIDDSTPELSWNDQVLSKTDQKRLEKKLFLQSNLNTITLPPLQTDSSSLDLIIIPEITSRPDHEELYTYMFIRFVVNSTMVLPLTPQDLITQQILSHPALKSHLGLINPIICTDPIIGMGDGNGGKTKARPKGDMGNNTRDVREWDGLQINNPNNNQNYSNRITPSHPNYDPNDQSHHDTIDPMTIIDNSRIDSHLSVDALPAFTMNTMSGSSHFDSIFNHQDTFSFDQLFNNNSTKNPSSDTKIEYNHSPLDLCGLISESPFSYLHPTNHSFTSLISLSSSTSSFLFPNPQSSSLLDPSLPSQIPSPNVVIVKYLRILPPSILFNDDSDNNEQEMKKKDYYLNSLHLTINLATKSTSTLFQNLSKQTITKFPDFFAHSLSKLIHRLTLELHSKFNFNTTPRGQIKLKTEQNTGLLAHSLSAMINLKCFSQSKNFHKNLSQIGFYSTQFMNSLHNLHSISNSTDNNNNNPALDPSQVNLNHYESQGLEDTIKSHLDKIFSRYHNTTDCSHCDTLIKLWGVTPWFSSQRTFSQINPSNLSNTFVGNGNRTINQTSSSTTTTSSCKQEEGAQSSLQDQFPLAFLPPANHCNNVTIARPIRDGIADHQSLSSIHSLPPSLESNTNLFSLGQDSFDINQQRPQHPFELTTCHCCPQFQKLTINSSSDPRFPLVTQTNTPQSLPYATILNVSPSFTQFCFCSHHFPHLIGLYHRKILLKTIQFFIHPFNIPINAILPLSVLLFHVGGIK